MPSPSPVLQRVIDGFRERRTARAGGPPPTIDELREGFVPAGSLHPVPDDVTVAGLDAGGVQAQWITAPGVGDAGVLLYLHGGGFSLGSVRSHGELAGRLGRASGLRVLLPEYRLAPEHTFPAGLDDVLTTWEWLRAAEGVDAANVAVVGDSSGGNLALSLLVALRDAGEDLPAAAVLLSPFVDLTVSGASITERADEDPIFTPDMIRGVAAGYLGDADPAAPLASPLFAPLAGLPPLLVVVGSAELLLSDAERLATAAEEAGVETTLVVGDGLPHVYPIVPDAPEAQEATARIADFIRSRVKAG